MMSMILQHSNYSNSSYYRTKFTRKYKQFKYRFFGYDRGRMSIEHLWNRFSQEYMNNLRKHQTYNRRKHNSLNKLIVDDMVIIKDGGWKGAGKVLYQN